MSKQTMSKNRAGGKTFNAKYQRYEKGGAATRGVRSGLKYAQTRPQEGREELENRPIIGREGEQTRNETLDKKDEFAKKAIEERGEAYEYSLVLNPGEGRTDVDLERYTREVMSRVEELRAENGAKIEWSAVVHRNQSDHDHVHVFVTTDKMIKSDELKTMQGKEVTGETWDKTVEHSRQQRELETQSRAEPIELRNPAEREREQLAERTQSQRDWHTEQHGGREL